MLVVLLLILFPLLLSSFFLFLLMLLSISSPLHLLDHRGLNSDGGRPVELRRESSRESVRKREGGRGEGGGYVNRGGGRGVGLVVAFERKWRTGSDRGPTAPAIGER